VQVHHVFVQANVCLFEPEDASLLQNLSISRKLRIHNVQWNFPQI